MIDWLRVFSLLVWLLPFSIFTPGLMRWLFDRSKALDALKSAVWFVAFVIIGFNLRWIAFPGPVDHMQSAEIALWSGLYVLSALAGLALTAAVYFDERS